jgi:hypothetical protein
MEHFQVTFEIPGQPSETVPGLTHDGVAFLQDAVMRAGGTSEVLSIVADAE